MGVGASTPARLPIIALGFVPVLFHVAIILASQDRLSFAPRFEELFKFGFVTAAALTHWAIYTSLFLTFAMTLRSGRDPLICAMARRLHGSIPEELEVYTRRVTIAWSCFFASQLVTSITLFVFAPLIVWSFFVNILDLPLVAGMFATEYMVRIRVLRNPPRHSLAMIMNMIADIKKPHQKPAARL